jgi:hypothetical protein
MRSGLAILCWNVLLFDSTHRVVNDVVRVFRRGREDYSIRLVTACGAVEVPNFYLS